MLDDENLFSYPYFLLDLRYTYPSYRQIVKMYVRVVNSIHSMQNGDKNRVKIGSDTKFITCVGRPKSIIFSKNSAGFGRTCQRHRQGGQNKGGESHAKST
jgi:hypothetical protein